MSRLVLCSWTDSYTGYGQHLREIVSYFVGKGHEVVVRPVKHSEKFRKIDPVVAERIVWDVQPEPWEVMLCPPNMPPTEGKRVIYFSMWETTRLHGLMVDNLNKAEIVIVPCTWNIQSFRASGVKRPIKLVPLGVNTDVFTPSPVSMEPFVFGCAGRLAHGERRKGVKDVIHVFRQAFDTHPDVRLHVKVFDDDKLPEMDDPRIVVEQRFLPEPELAAWMRELTVFVSLARAEGWGLLQLQAMSCGRPLVASLYGGLKEFAGEHNSFSVPFEERSPDDNNQYFKVGKWAHPRMDRAVQGLRWIRAHPEEVRQKAVAAAESARRFSWRHSCEELEKVLQQVGVIG